MRYQRTVNVSWGRRVIFRVVSENCQINFVRCYANCPDPGDVLILIIEATLRYGVSNRSSNLEICFLSLEFSTYPPIPWVLLLFSPYILLHLAGRMICLTLNVIRKITRLRAACFLASQNYVLANFRIESSGEVYICKIQRTDILFTSVSVQLSKFVA